jgi:hypothetical protein
MTLRQRLARLEAQRATNHAEADILIHEIAWANGDVIGAIARVLTPTGWETIMRWAGEPGEAFEARAEALKARSE